MAAAGFDRIRAAHIKGFEERRPEPVTSAPSGPSWRPDISAEKAGRRYLFEVETVDSMASPQTESEFRVFAAASEQEGRFFYAVVPSDCVAAVRCLLLRARTAKKQQAGVLPFGSLPDG